MADTKISDLTAVVTPADTDEFVVNQGGTSKKATRAQILAATHPTFTDWAFNAYESAGGDTLNTSAQDVSLDTEGESDANFSWSDPVVTVTAAGLYLVHFQMCCEYGVAGWAWWDSYLTESDNTEYPGTRSGNLASGTLGSNATTTAQMILRLSASDTIKARAIGSSTSLSIVPNGASLTVIRLGD